MESKTEKFDVTEFVRKIGLMARQGSLDKAIDLLYDETCNKNLSVTVFSTTFVRIMKENESTKTLA